MALSIIKVNTLPVEVAADTIYLVKNAVSDLIDIYVTSSDGLEVRHLPSAGEVLSGVITYSATAPALPNSNPFWQKPVTGEFFYQKKDSEGVVTWAEVGGVGAALSPIESESTPDLPNTNPFWIKTSTGEFYVQYDNGSTVVWKNASPKTSLVRNVRTSAVAIQATDNGSLLEITTGFSETQPIATASELGAGWWCYLKNSTETDIKMSTSLGVERVINPDFGATEAVTVPNAGFDTDTAWTKGTGWTISGGKAVASNSSNTYLTSSITALAAGSMVKITLDVTVTAGYVAVDVGSTAVNINTSGTHTVYVTGGSVLRFRSYTGFTGTIDNISCQRLVGVTNSAGSPPVDWNGTAINFTSYAADAAAGAFKLSMNALEVGKIYQVTYTVTRTAGNIRFSLNDVVDGVTRDASGTYTETFVATQAFTTIHFERVSGSFTGSITSLSVKKVTGVIDSDVDNGLIYMYPSEMRLIYSDGSVIKSTPIRSFKKTFITSGMFYKPPGYRAFESSIWGRGGDGLNIGNFYVEDISTYLTYIYGGSGGACSKTKYQNEELASIESVILSASNGLNSTFAKSTAQSGSVGGRRNVSYGTVARSDNSRNLAMDGGGHIDYSTAPNDQTVSPLYGGSAGKQIYLNERTAITLSLSSPMFGGWTISGTTATHLSGATETYVLRVQFSATTGKLYRLRIGKTTGGGSLSSTVKFLQGVSDGGRTHSLWYYTDSNIYSEIFFIATGTVVIFDFGVATGNTGNTSTYSFFVDQQTDFETGLSEASRNKSRYGGSSGWVDTNQLNTSGEPRGGGGSIYIVNTVDDNTKGRGGLAECVIEGVL